MPNRIIKDSINESKGLSEVSFFAEDLYKRLITYADDYGRFNADCQIMRARLYPREIEIVSESDIEDALIELSGVGKVAFYTSYARKEIYGCLPKWSEHQRIRDSKNKCPDPDDTYVNDWYLRRFVPIKMKMDIIERDGFKCQICGRYISAADNAYAVVKMGSGLFHIDHIVPVSQGGRATMENLRLTCPKCNQSRKKKFTFDEILKMTRDLQKDAARCGELPKKSALIQSESKSESESKSYTGDVRLDGAILDFIEHRRKMRKPMTDRAIELMITKLKKLGKDTDEQIDIINQSIERGWQGVFPLEAVNNKQKSSFNNFKGRDYSGQMDDLTKALIEGGK